jgi:hypothetical protein
VREEVEALEDHANPRSLSCDVFILTDVQLAVAVLEANQLTPHPDPASRQDLHLVDQA